MAEVDFTDKGAAKAWFEKQTPEVRSTMASRAALRMAANLGQYGGERTDTLVLTAMRSTLTSAVRGLGQTADVGWLKRAAHSANSAARSAAYSVAQFAYSATQSAHSAALSAAYSAAHSAHSAALSAAHSAAYSAAQSAYSAAQSALSADNSAYSAANSAAQWDSNNIGVDLNTHPLWADVEVPKDMVAQHDVFLTRLRATADWDFFRTWYEQMWEGKFADWDLATEVAKIGDDVWEAGLGAVAEAIRGIEARSTDRSKQITPEEVATDNVVKLFNRAPIVQASMATMSEAISLRIDAFTSMYASNEEIAFVEALRNMPDTAQRIHDILDKGTDAPNAATALALEVGRLRAENENLKAKLKEAEATIDELKSKPWYKKSSILFAGTVTSAIGLALWTISDPEFDGENRWNNVAEELNFLWSRLAPAAEDELLQNPRFELPDIEDV